MKLKISFFLFWLLMIGANDIYGQKDVDKGTRMSGGFDYSAVYDLNSVTFWEPSGIFNYKGWIQIMSDNVPNIPISGSSNTLAWENGTKAKPIAYVSDYEPRLEAEFTINCPSGNASQYFAKATNSSGYNFPPKQLTMNNGKYKYPKTNCDKKFYKEVVRYWEDFELEWHVSNNANGPWISVGTSKNYMYVTHKTPIIGVEPLGHAEPISAQHTFLHLGCLNANGQSIDSNIVDAIYNEFTDRDVRRFDGAGPIQYWGTGVGQPACWQPSQMLINLDGRCGGWAAFMDVLIRLQGIALTEMVGVDYNSQDLPQSSIQAQKNDIMALFGNEYVNVHTLDKNLNIDGLPPMSHFYVKNWDLTIAVPDKFFVHHFYNDQIGSSTLPITLLNNFVITDKEEFGSIAQGNSNPRSEFENHAIVKFNGKYYDPSYGSTPSLTANDWENSSIDALGGMVYFLQVNPINGIIDRYFINWLDFLNTTSQQLNIIP